jgi:hypothetical protein
MRKLIGLLVFMGLSISVSASTLDIQVENYLETDFDFMFEIQNKNFDKVVLDCQSFINGVNLYGEGGEHAVLVLDIGECEDIHFSIIEGMQNDSPVCLSLDFNNRAYKVSEDFCN